MLTRSPVSVSIPSGCQVRPAAVPPDMRQRQRRPDQIIIRPDDGYGKGGVIALVFGQPAGQPDIGRNQAQGRGSGGSSLLRSPKPLGSPPTIPPKGSFGPLRCICRLYPRDTFEASEVALEYSVRTVPGSASQRTPVDREIHAPASSCPARLGAGRDCRSRSMTEAGGVRPARRRRRSVPVRSCGWTSLRT